MIITSIIAAFLLTVILIVMDLKIKNFILIKIVFILLFIWSLSLLSIIILEKSNILVLDLHNSYAGSIFVFGAMFIAIPFTVIFGLYLLIKRIIKK